MRVNQAPSHRLSPTALLGVFLSAQAVFDDIQYGHAARGKLRVPQLTGQGQGGLKIALSFLKYALHKVAATGTEVGRCGLLANTRPRIGPPGIRERISHGLLQFAFARPCRRSTKLLGRLVVRTLQHVDTPTGHR